jgi:hypothetical protein
VDITWVSQFVELMNEDFNVRLLFLHFSCLFPFFFNPHLPSMTCPRARQLRAQLSGVSFAMYYHALRVVGICELICCGITWKRSIFTLPCLSNIAAVSLIKINAKWNFQLKKMLYCEFCGVYVRVLNVWYGYLESMVEWFK